jgi:hypothetical protein
MTGPGKYDEAATEARESTQAEGVILIVLNGNRGTGFSAQFVSLGMVQSIPEVLRQVADEIEADKPPVTGKWVSPRRN